METTEYTCGYCDAPLKDCDCGKSISTDQVKPTCGECEKKQAVIDVQRGRIADLMNVVNGLTQVKPTKEHTVVLRVHPQFMEKIRYLSDGRLPS